jgi:hypothetical protein
VGPKHTRAWLEAHSRLSALLYERDPEGMGASVSAPRDEYDDVATRLLREILRRPADADQAEIVLNVLPSAWPELVAEILEVSAAYERFSHGGHDQVS